jgi:predicted ATPase/DNA-binding SARP family transcriptional activator
LTTLGPLELVVDGTPVPLGGPKQRIVLALLALRAPEVVAADELVEAVWPEAMPERPTDVLKVYVANLRRLLAGDHRETSTRSAIVRRDRGYALELPGEQLDRLRFETLVDAANVRLEGDDVEGCASDLRRAAGLWHGPAFPDLQDVGSAQPELRSLEERRLAATELLLDVDLAVGRHVDVVAAATALIERFPYRERLRVVHAIALYRSQRQAEALEACRRGRVALAEELGLEPGPALRDLESAILRHDLALAPSHFGEKQRRASNRPRHYLPATVTTLVGRDEDIRSLVDLLTDRPIRLVTIVGTGGIGKTRLAVEVGHALSPQLRDGVWFVQLAGAEDDDGVLRAIARAIGATTRTESETQTAVKEFFRTRSALLILDEFEHALDAWAVPSDLLKWAADIKILITSRSPLHVSGELVYDVTPLPVPPPGAPLDADGLRRVPAVELFADRARLVDRRFVVDSTNRAPITEICRRLDGLPLALELAGARMAQTTAHDMALALDDQFVLLTDGPRDADPRSRSLATSLRASTELLRPPEEAVLVQLSVFVGEPWLRDVVEVCMRHDPEVAPTLVDERVTAAVARLVELSLVRARDDPPLGRLSVLRPIAEFARYELDGADDAPFARHHARHFADVADLEAPRLQGADVGAALGRLRERHLELMGALSWATGEGGDLTIARRLVSSLWHYAEITCEVAELHMYAGRILGAALPADDALAAATFSAAGTLAWLQGDLAGATEFHQRAHDLFVEVGDRRGEAWSLMCLATQYVMRDDLREGWRLATAARDLGHTLGDRRTAAYAQCAMGAICEYQHQSAEAERLQLEALEWGEESGDVWSCNMMRINLANITEHAGRYDEADGWLRESLRSSRSIGDRVQAVFGVESIAELRLRRGRPLDAARLVACASAYRSDHAVPLSPHEQRLQDDILAAARNLADPTSFRLATWEGGLLTLDEAIEEALHERA